MNKSFLVHNAAGKILVTGYSDEEGTLGFYSGPDEYVLFGLEGPDSNTDWVDASQTPPAILPRETPPIQVVGTQVRHIPTPATLRLDGPMPVEAQVTEATVELTADLPGIYQLTVEPESARWLPFEAEITL